MSSSGVAAISPVHSEPLAPKTCRCSSHLSLDDSIYIFLAFSGQVTPMRVLEWDTIESVKLKIQNCNGFLSRKQKLVCGGRELARSDSFLRDYGVTDGIVMHLVLKLSDLQMISVKTTSGKEYSFHVERCRDVGYVKQQVAQREKQLSDPEQQEVLCNGEQLEDQRRIEDICLNHNDAVLRLLIKKSTKVQARPVQKNIVLSVVATELNNRKNFDTDRSNNSYDIGEEVSEDIVPGKLPDRHVLLEPVIVNPNVKLASVVCDMVDLTCDGLENGNYPVRSAEGTGGAYFMMDSTGQNYVSVFKPIDEEPMAVNNPRGLPMSLDGEGLKRGTIVGEGAFREVAAYILDHPLSGRRMLFGDNKGFAGVPPTVLVKCFHDGFNNNGDSIVKIGSLQMFMENKGSCEDMGPGAFPVQEVHKISVLDMRLANADRHGGNILIGATDENGQAELIPIDHGYCLPTSFEDCTFEWLYWPQARQPYSQETFDYIKSLDAEEDIILLKFHGWDLPIECARILRISTMLLKKGVERGLTPFEIGSLMCRKSLKEESAIEEIVQAALDAVLPGTSEATLLEVVSEIMDQRLDEISGSPS